MWGGIERGNYIRLREADKQVFQYEEKTNLFPRYFFPVSGFITRLLQGHLMTVLSSALLLYSVHLMEFHPAIDKLVAVEVSSDERQMHIFIPVQWVDYQIRRDSENLDSSFSEGMITGYDESLRYLKIQFKGVITGYSGKNRLKNVYIRDGYFSFDIEITKKNEEDITYLVKYVFQKQTVDRLEGQVTECL